jgi:hypothetical protein
MIMVAVSPFILSRDKCFPLTVSDSKKSGAFEPSVTIVEGVLAIMRS